MIKHHPSFELLQSYVNGDMPASLAAAVSIHASMCPNCAEKIAQLTEQMAEASFELDLLGIPLVGDSEKTEDIADEFDFDQMLASITSNSDVFESTPIVEKNIVFNNQSYRLPSQLNNMALGKTSTIGKLTRTRVQLDENEIHSSLLHIEPGGGVPVHTHKGFELTLLLDGSFEDEQGEYVKGDFIMLDGSHEHSPVSAQGCLCFTVANDAIQFTKGINKLLNPIGGFIY